MLRPSRPAASIHLECAPEVAAALSGSGAPEPSGWLAQLQRLRDLSARENRLVPHWNLGQGDPGQSIDVPGLGLQDPMAYLRAAREQVGGLVAAILKDVDAVSKSGRPRDGARSKTQSRPLPDLSARAWLVTPTHPRGQRGMRPRTDQSDGKLAEPDLSTFDDGQTR